MRGFYAKQSQLANGYAIKSQDLSVDYLNELQELNADINNRVRLLSESYTQELKAAASGDDSVERSSVASRKYQREHAKLGVEYGKAWREIHAKYAEAFQSLQAEARLQSLDDTIEYLREVRQALSPESSKPEDPGKPA